MKHMNTVILSGKAKHIKTITFSNNYKVIVGMQYGISVGVSVKDKDFYNSMMSKLKDEPTVLVMGRFQSAQDKKKPGNWYYEIASSSISVAIGPELNMATVIGTVVCSEQVGTDVGPKSRILISCMSHSKTKEKKQTFIWTMIDNAQPVVNGQTVLVRGSVQRTGYITYIGGDSIWLL